jgi:hypothetical protein
MLHKLAIASAIIVLAATLPVPASLGYAEDAAPVDPGPWPIWHWHNHQPRQDQLEALHENDLTPKEAREVDRLYEQLMDPAWLAERAAPLPCRHQHHRKCRGDGVPNLP